MKQQILHHLSQTFSHTDNTITNGQFYLCAGIVVLVFTFLLVKVLKSNNNANLL